MIRFALSIFLSAFLLFLIQPIIARYILPWYGGTAMVWSMCLLFFQVTLLAGYLYAHLIRLFLRPSQQAMIHVFLIICAITLLPISPDATLIPEVNTNPSLSILLLLAVTVGIPYWLISASGPLIQHWFKLSLPNSSPYRLYALSNAGSLLALFAYPFVIEPNVTLHTQSWIWSAGFLIYVLLCTSCAWSLHRATKNTELDKIFKNTSDGAFVVARTTRLLWVVLPGAASILLLATTNQICQDISVVPFLWLLPLSFYLLSFIICFDRPNGYDRRIWIPMFILSIFFGIYADILASQSTLFFQISVYSSILFTACMVCHGEMVRLKPPAEQLTSFYLYIALGGALGSAFVTLLAPLIFQSYWELQLGWCLTLVLLGVCLFRLPSQRKYWRNILLLTTWVSLCGVVATLLFSQVAASNAGIVAIHRDFYGVLRVKEKEYESAKYPTVRERSLSHGGILHGSQIINNAKSRLLPTTYYSKQSGIGLAIREYPRKNQKGIHIGVLGMGVGTIAALCSKEDSIRFYEINPHVVDIAQTHFSFLKDTPAQWQAIIGDGRISLHRELENQQTQL
ncbi:MAG: hypothetical protein ACI9MF_002665, partial [Gammaproteobacteria bacterium]